MTNSVQELRAKMMGSKNKSYAFNQGCLGYVPDFKRSGKENVPAVVGIDTGCTETRAQAITDEITADLSLKNPEDAYLIIPTDLKYSQSVKPGDVGFNYNVIPYRDMELYNSMDTVISPLNNKEGLSEPIRCLRGDEASAYGDRVTPMAINKSDRKCDDPGYITTTIDAIGYSLVHAYSKNNLPIPKSFDVVLNLSTRPHEVDGRTVDTLNKKLLGQFSWRALRYDKGYNSDTEIDTEIIINIKGITLTSEGVTQIRHYFRTRLKPRKIVSATLGGSNVSTEALFDNKMRLEASLDLDLSGRSIMNEFRDDVVAMVRQTPDLADFSMTDAQLFDYLNTGCINIKGKRKSLSKPIVAVKDTVADKIYQALKSKIFVMPEFSMSNIDTLMITGNLANPTMLETFTNKAKKGEIELGSVKFSRLLKEIGNREPSVEEEVELDKAYEEKRLQEPSIMYKLTELLVQEDTQSQVVVIPHNYIPVSNLFTAFEEGKFTDIVDKVFAKLIEGNEEFFNKYSEYNTGFRDDEVEEEIEEKKTVEAEVAVAGNKSNSIFDDEDEDFEEEVEEETKPVETLHLADKEETISDVFESEDKNSNFDSSNLESIFEGGNF